MNVPFKKSLVLTSLLLLIKLKVSFFGLEGSKILYSFDGLEPGVKGKSGGSKKDLVSEVCESTVKSVKKSFEKRD